MVAALCQDAVAQARAGGDESGEGAVRVEGGEDGFVAVVENPAVALRGGLTPQWAMVSAYVGNQSERSLACHPAKCA